MRALLVIALAGCLGACKGNSEQKSATTGSGAGAGSAAAEVKIDWTACDKALANAAEAPLDARPAIIIDGCQVCGGDWKPLLMWNRDPASGGPKREHIEQRMVACNAFCTGTSKLEFMGSLDKTRGQGINTPWRELEKTCKERVNGAADPRFMSAPFFALDRIARAAAAKGGATADKLAAIELPLPPVTISGVGVALPDSAAVTPKVGELAVTVLGDAIQVGRMPRGKLTAAGVSAKPDYPGNPVQVEQLGAKLLELVGEDKTQTITILAPHAMPAINLVPIIAAAATVAPVYLGAHAYEAPEGWQLAGAIPIALEAGSGVKVTDEMTVQNLAGELAARVARKQSKVGVTKH
jgi:hypothetical protein